MTKHYLYTLVFEAEPQPVVFYVGHTNDPKRRLAEHRSAVKDLTNTEYKYQYARELEAIGVGWEFVVVGEIEDDEDSEYEWILRFARDNQQRGISFYKGLHLTNMKAGDFYHEILHREDIQTAKDIKAFRAELKAAQFEAEVNYDRRKNVLDYFNPTPRPLTQRAELLAAHMNELAAAQREVDEAKRQRKIRQAEAYWAMLNDPERQSRIEAETRRLEELDK